MLIFQPFANFYKKYEHRISSFSLFLGFAFDAFTLKRVDQLFENILIALYLVLIGVFIILIHTTENKLGEESPKAHFWYVNILQFLFGGVFSAYLILYFRSADIWVTWPFIILLAIIFIANEFLKQHYVKLSIQITLYFLAIYSFLIFFIPVVLHKIGPSIFLFSGLVSIILIYLFIKALFYFIKDRFSKSERLLQSLITLVFILVNFLYFTNLIPPIPLSLKDAGVFHSIQKNKEGNYYVTFEDLGFRGYLQFYPDFKAVTGSPIYAFSAIFSPKYLNIAILHEWQQWSEEKKEWNTERVINLSVVGGRDGGFRTYSSRFNLEEGKWRVNIKTEEGQIVGRLRFRVVLVDEKPELTAAVK
ncbi:DUF2914 domain-containing protein [Candidatus Nomurabacteria bacterium]|nr:DUF2914 domain-containing protein [Candidatus Nomurabacteria bacterium]